MLYWIVKWSFREVLISFESPTIRSTSVRSRETAQRSVETISFAQISQYSWKYTSALCGLPRLWSFLGQRHSVSITTTALFPIKCLIYIIQNSTDRRWSRNRGNMEGSQWIIPCTGMVWSVPGAHLANESLAPPSNHFVDLSWLRQVFPNMYMSLLCIYNSNDGQQWVWRRNFLLSSSDLFFWLSLTQSAGMGTCGSDVIMWLNSLCGTNAEKSTGSIWESASHWFECNIWRCDYHSRTVWSSGLLTKCEPVFCKTSFLCFVDMDYRICQLHDPPLTGEDSSIGFIGVVGEA
jgi:hypothetical protein